jgi:hypothetical protein
MCTTVEYGISYPNFTNITLKMHKTVKPFSISQSSHPANDTGKNNRKDTTNRHYLVR